MKVFLDASVIIAAFLSKTGGSAKILHLGKTGRVRLVTSETVIKEVRDNLKKVGRTQKQLIEFINDFPLVIRQQITTADIKPYQKKIDEKDAHVVAGAKLTSCQHLITLDKKHLLKSEIKDKFVPLQIVSPKEFLLEHVLDAK